MAAFRNDPSEWERLDWQLLQSGPIALYWRQAVLEGDCAWFAAHGYRVYRIDARAWDSAAAFHSDVRRILGFPDYYGENLDAFSDCLSDLSVSEDGGSVLQFVHFDAFARWQPRLAHAVLDIIAANARVFLLTGRRLLALVQSDDPQLKFESVGGSPVGWNQQEWLDANRDRDRAT